MESAGQNRNLQGISPQIVNLALQNGIISPSLSASSLPATFDVACSNQAPSTSYSAIVPTQPLSVPFFETETFKNVNLNVAPSSLLNGLDLPTDDVTTLR
ncbi:unnamed protein product [Enterobius vermicularis]|uniref:WRKY transcription factor n=1 Tax=Enterobius vermicularis TaxID=51028 RepID=A0A0N4VKM3_ENTVE|nr:unnamed protein product [Enterobius vermicularis]